MKIKSINDFTLAECQEYLDTNSNGELAQEVAQRMEYLRQLKERKLQQDRARRINEFNTEFNRYYATQRYEDAFAICLKYINNIDDKTVVLEKANLVIHKLKNRILLPSSAAISYDWLIDQLVLKGYDKMKYDGNSLKWKKSRILIKQQSEALEIICKCRAHLLIRILCVPILIFLTVLIAAVIIELLGHEILYGGDYWTYYDTELYYEMLIIGILCSLVFLFWWLRIYIKMHKEPRLLLRRIANIVIDNLAKQ